MRGKEVLTNDEIDELLDRIQAKEDQDMEDMIEYGKYREMGKGEAMGNCKSQIRYLLESFQEYVTNSMKCDCGTSDWLEDNETWIQGIENALASREKNTSDKILRRAMWNAMEYMRNVISKHEDREAYDEKSTYIEQYVNEHRYLIE